MSLDTGTNFEYWFSANDAGFLENSTCTSPVASLNVGTYVVAEPGATSAILLSRYLECVSYLL